MKDLIFNFENSEFYKEFKRKLDQNRAEAGLFNKKYFGLFKRKMAEVMLTTHELEQEVNTILQYANLNIEYDHKIHHNFMLTPKEDLFKDFVTTLSQWHYYLNHQSSLENYELCAKIRDVVKIEVEFFTDALKEFCPEYITQDLELIDYCLNEVQSTFIQ